MNRTPGDQLRAFPFGEAVGTSNRTRIFYALLYTADKIVYV